MLRYSLVLAVGLVFTGSASASTWADALFDELSRDFGTVPRGPMLTHQFTVTNKTNNNVTISNVRVSCGCTSATALQANLAPGQSTVVVATMDTRRFSGTKSVTIYVQFSQPRFDEVRLWVQANSRDDLSISPDALAFGKIKRGTAPTATTTVTFFGNSNWQITGAQCESNYVKTTLEQVRREGSEVVYKLSATMRGDAPAGRWFTEVWLTTNSPSTPKIRVPLTVEIEAPLTVSPGTVGLGEIKAGKSAERKVIVRGVQPFRILGVKGTDKELSVRDSTSESKTVHVLTVTANPNRMGDFVRTLQVQTDLKGDETIEFITMASVVP